MLGQSVRTWFLLFTCLKYVIPTVMACIRLVPPALAAAQDWKRMFAGVKEILSLLVVALIVYAMLVLAIGKPFLPNDGAAWGLCLVWFCSHIGGWLATKVDHSSCLRALTSTGSCGKLPARVPVEAIHQPVPEPLSNSNAVLG